MGGHQRKSRRIATDSDTSDTSDTVAKTKTSRGGKQSKPKPRFDDMAASQAQLDHLRMIASSVDHRQAREERMRLREQRDRIGSSSSFGVDKKHKKSTKKTKHEAPPSSDSESESESETKSETGSESESEFDSPAPVKKPKKSSKKTKKEARPPTDSDSESSVVAKTKRSAKSNKSAKTSKHKAQPVTDSDSSVVDKKPKKSTKSSKSTKKAKRDAQPSSDSDSDSDSSSDSPVPAKKSKKSTKTKHEAPPLSKHKSTKKPVESSSESESEDSSVARRKKKSSKTDKKNQHRQVEGSESDTSNPALPRGRKPNLDINQLNTGSVHSFAKVAKSHNGTSSVVVAIRSKGYVSEAQIREALALKPRVNVEIGPEGFGCQRDEDSGRIVFASRYGGTKGCQSNLCYVAFVLNKECPDGINCNLVHVWFNQESMNYLATQPSQWGREAFRQFCAEVYPKWLRNFNKFYKNHARTEPLPSVPVTAWLGPRSHDQAAKKALVRTGGHSDTHKVGNIANFGNPPPRGAILKGTQTGMTNPLPGLIQMVETGKHDIREPAQTMAEAQADPTDNGQHVYGSFFQKIADWHNSLKLRMSEAEDKAKKQKLKEEEDERVARGGARFVFLEKATVGPPGAKKVLLTKTSIHQPDLTKMTPAEVLLLRESMIEEEEANEANKKAIVEADESNSSESFVRNSNEDPEVAPVPQIVVPEIPEPLAPGAQELERSSKKKNKKEKKEKKASDGGQSATVEDA